MKLMKFLQTHTVLANGYLVTKADLFTFEPSRYPFAREIAKEGVVCLSAGGLNYVVPQQELLSVPSGDWACTNALIRHASGYLAECILTLQVQLPPVRLNTLFDNIPWSNTDYRMYVDGKPVVSVTIGKHYDSFVYKVSYTDVDQRVVSVLVPDQGVEVDVNGNFTLAVHKALSETIWSEDVHYQVFNVKVMTPLKADDLRELCPE